MGDGIPSSGSKKKTIIIVSIIAGVVLIMIVAFLIYRSGNDTENACGNGLIDDVEEECDDGNRNFFFTTDGCSRSCKINSGWLCTGEPSICEKEVTTGDDNTTGDDDIPPGDDDDTPPPGDDDIPPGDDDDTPPPGGSTWSVQSGETQMTGLSETITLSEAVNRDKAFIILQVRGNKNDPSRLSVYSEWVSDNEFTLNQLSTNENGPTIVWSVIEGSKINVQSGTQEFAKPDTEIDVTVNSIDLEKTVVFLSRGSCGNTNSKFMKQVFWTGRMARTDALRLNRDSSGDCEGTISYFVVEFNDGSIIQSGEIADVDLKKENKPVTVSIDSVDMATTWLYFTFAANDEDLENMYATGWQSADDEISFQTASGNGNGKTRVQWYTITTPGSRVQQGSEFFKTDSGSFAEVSIDSVDLGRSFAWVTYNNSGSGNSQGNSQGSAFIFDSSILYVERGDPQNKQTMAWQVIELPT